MYLLIQENEDEYIDSTLQGYLFAAAELGSRVIAKCLDKDLITKGLVVLQTEDLGQTNLPRGVARQLDVGAEEDQQIGLGHDALRKLGVDQIHGDIAGRKFALLRHVSESPGEVNDRLATVLGGNEVDAKLAGRIGAHRSGRSECLAMW